jgi:hypothetical protein
MASLIQSLVSGEGWVVKGTPQLLYFSGWWEWRHVFSEIERFAHTGSPTPDHPDFRKSYINW